MTDLSARLSLPFLLPAQAQKHVTHNEALERLDRLVQLSVAGFDAITPPAAAPEGQIWALGAQPAGDWTGQGGTLACRATGGWVFESPQTGWLAVQGTELRVFDGAAWVFPDPGLLQNLPGLGIGTSPDTTNRLAVASPATLLTHEGAGHQVKVNKAAAADTASLLFQTGWSGRAEMGLVGEDDFSLKVSADGTSFATALRADRATGRVTMPAGAEIAGPLSGTAVTQSATDKTEGRLLKVGDFGLGRDPLTTSGATPFSTYFDLNGFIHNSSTSNNPADAPRGNRYHWGWTVNTSDLRGAQFLVDESSRAWIRTHGNGVYGDWTELYGTNRLLSPVSQSGGVPTGGVIERGSSANGDYVRFADGTQICWLYETPVNVNSTGTQVASWPAAFADVPVVSMNQLTNNPNHALRWNNMRFVRGTATVAVFRLITSGTSADPASAEEKVSFTGFGRWF